MVGRSLLPFGDTFAVFMVVFLVLSLSVGRFTSGPDGAAVREPMLITVGGGDPFGTEAEALVAFSSNADGVDYRHTAAHRIGDAERIIAFLQGVLQDVEIVAQFLTPVTDFPSDWVTPIPASTPQVEEFINAFQIDVPRFGTGMDWHFVNALEDGSLPLSNAVIPDNDLYALTDNCRPFQAEERSNLLSGAVDLNATGFGDSVAKASVSLALDAARSDLVTLSGIFEAPPPPAAPEIVVDRLAFSPARCLGFEGAVDGVLEPDTVVDPTAPCGRFQSPIEGSYLFARANAALQSRPNVPPAGSQRLVSEILRLPSVIVRPSDPEQRRQLGELVYHSVIPRPVEIRVFETDGGERLFRTPTWWEMFRSGRGVSPNNAWTTEAQCRANAAAFVAREADDTAYLFSFRMTVDRSGDIDHHGTLIELPMKAAQ